MDWYTQVMNDTMPILDKTVLWSESDPNTLAGVLVGSHARGQARPDSDIDLVFICDDSAKFLESDEWINQFGSYKSINREDWGNVQTRRVFFDSGLEVEFNFTDKEWTKLLLDTGTKAVLENGYQVLVGKLNLLVGILT